MSKQFQINLFFLMAVAIALLGLGATATKIKASESTVGCPDCGPKEPVPVTNGFYRQINDPKVYFLDLRKNTMCHVQNPSQMEAFGGFQQVRIILDYSFKSDKKFIGGCTWPSGFFRKSNETSVFFMFNDGRNFCHVTDPQQMERFGGFSKVKVVGSDSVLRSGRIYLGSCSG